MITKCTCTECGSNIEFEAEGAGQTIACPRCGKEATLYFPTAIKSATVQFKPALPTNSPPIIATPGNDVFFSDTGILVSKTLIVVGSQTFALANVSSVRGVKIPPSRVGPIIVLFLGLVFLASLLWLGIFVIAFSIAWMCFQKSRFSIILTPAGGEVNAYVSKYKALVSHIIRAITDAIVARG